MKDVLNNLTAERRNEGSEKAGWNREEIMKPKKRKELAVKKEQKQNRIRRNEDKMSWGKTEEKI